MRGPAKPHHPLAAAMIGMTAQAVFPDLRRPPDDVAQTHQPDPEREAAAAAKRERKNLKRKGNHG